MLGKKKNWCALPCVWCRMSKKSPRLTPSRTPDEKDGEEGDEDTLHAPRKSAPKTTHIDPYRKVEVKTTYNEETGMYSKPSGKPPKNTEWDYVKGGWKPVPISKKTGDAASQRKKDAAQKKTEDGATS